MKNKYQSLMNDIPVPEGLHERVLSAARRSAPEKHRLRPLWRTAVCAACVLALVGGFRLGDGTLPGKEPERVEYAEVLTLPPFFTLTACAAELDADTINGSLLLGAKEKTEEEKTVTHMVLSLEELEFTDYRFRISGHELRSVTLAVSRGGLYRFAPNGVCTPLGAEVTEAYDPDAVYGLWAPKEQLRPLQEQPADLFDGAALTVTVTAGDGQKISRTYTLTAQQLRAFESEDGCQLIPTLEGDTGSVVGLYAEPEDSRWLRWPVEGANTVSLSNSYGFRTAPGGVGGAFHAGIDIPAAQGTPVQAAADGQVTEVGFDPDKGNYLILDHGDGLTTLYGQCLSVAVEKGEAVAAGQEIAAVGSTGKSTGPHLHFEVRQEGEARNPVAYFSAAVRDTLKMG